MEYLGNNKTYIREFFVESGYNYIDNVKSVLGERCKIVGIENYPSYEYYKIETSCPYNPMLCVSKKTNAFVVSVEKGIFAGGTCVVEQNSGIEKSTNISVISKSGIFKFPAYQGFLNDSDIDFLLGNKGICSAISNEATVFDITKKYQYFEHMCDNLPEEFWQNDNMIKNVLNAIEASKFQFLNVFNKEFINEDKVREQVYFKFLQYSQKHNKNFQEIEK